MISIWSCSANTEPLSLEISIVGCVSSWMTNIKSLLWIHSPKKIIIAVDILTTTGISWSRFSLCLVTYHCQVFVFPLLTACKEILHKNVFYSIPKVTCFIFIALYFSSPYESILNHTFSKRTKRYS